MRIARPLKELTTTCRARRISPHRWVPLALTTFLYLEWHRASHCARRDLRPEQKRWWRCQRTFGLCQAVRQAAERNELASVAQQLNQPRGVKKMQALFHNACAAEYRCPV